MPHEPTVCLITKPPNTTYKAVHSAGPKKLDNFSLEIGPKPGSQHDYNVAGRVTIAGIPRNYNNTNLEALLVLDTAHELPRAIKARLISELSSMKAKVRNLPTAKVKKLTTARVRKVAKVRKLPTAGVTRVAPPLVH